MTKINGGGGPQYLGGANGANNQKQIGQGAASAGAPSFNVGPKTDAVSFSGGIPTAGAHSFTHNVDFKAISERPVSYYDPTKNGLPPGHPDRIDVTTFGGVAKFF